MATPAYRQCPDTEDCRHIVQFQGNKKPEFITCNMDDFGFFEESGGVLLSHPASRAVPSALKGLTSVFGMGTGVTPSLSPPKIGLANYLTICLREKRRTIGLDLCELFCGQATRSISTGKLSALPHLHIRPINLVVYKGSLGSMFPYLREI